MSGGGFTGRWIAFAAVLALLFSPPMRPAQAQPDYRSASPRQLVRAWGSAPRQERRAIADAMVSRRAQVLPSLREAARSGDRSEKFFACSMIAEMRDRDGVDALLVASTDADVKVRRRAATALRILADRRSARRLRQMVRSETDLGAFKTAVAALGRLGLRRDLGLIEPLLAHTDHEVRVIAAAAMAMLGDERGLDLVVRATEADNPAVQKTATYVLGLFGGDAAGARLQAILDDPNGAWRNYALIATAERQMAAQSDSERIATLDGLANGRSRTAAEWAVERLTDIGNDDAAEVLRRVRQRSTPVGAKAQRRLKLIEAQP